MKAFLKIDPSRTGLVSRVYVTEEGQKRLEVVLDDEDSGGLSIIDADVSVFEISDV